MRYKAFYLILPAILSAGSIEISLQNHQGKSSYIVNNNTQTLKSKLIFPFNYNTINIEYKKNLKYLDIYLYSSLKLDSTTTKGEDFDWQNDNLTVYSKSDNKIDKYYSIGLKISKNISPNISIFSKFKYQILDIYWLNTKQHDYIQNSDKYVSKTTIKFQQKYYNYYVGIIYQKKLTKKLFLELTPSVVYAYINTKDKHLLRSFYTTQNTKSFGYDIKCKLNYNLSSKSNLKLSLGYINLKDKNVNMNYYNILGERYLTYPSSYRYRSTIIGLHYNHNF